ncbi:MAG TPA: hypothetical protein VGL81_28955 [Polyangiaceae bacterium]|jgi:hypothetical protein
MTRDELKFRAALSRFAVGVIALAVLPTFYPETRRHVWVWFLYLAIAAVEQVLIRKHIGGRVRPVVSGLVDLAVLTYTVHGLGSVVTPMASLYLFAGVANALVTSPRVAWTLAIVGGSRTTRWSGPSTRAGSRSRRTRPTSRRSGRRRSRTR